MYIIHTHTHTHTHTHSELVEDAVVQADKATKSHITAFILLAPSVAAGINSQTPAA